MQKVSGCYSEASHACSLKLSPSHLLISLAFQSSIGVAVGSIGFEASFSRGSRARLESHRYSYISRGRTICIDATIPWNKQSAGGASMGNWQSNELVVTVQSQIFASYVAVRRASMSTNI